MAVNTHVINAVDLLRLTLPEIVVGLAALLTLTLDLVVLKGRAAAVRWKAGALVACAGCAGAILLLVLRPETATLYDGMLVVAPLTQMVEAVLAGFTILAVLLSVDSDFTQHIGEYLALMLFATAGMMVLVSTRNLLVIFASLELLSLSLYILTAFNKRSRLSAEGALKYFLFGGMAAAFFLFGISLLYGLSGSIQMSGVASALETQSLTPLWMVAIVMVVTGLGFKVAAAPFHLWAPDAYQGAPTPSAAMIASSSKIASFFVFATVMVMGLTAGARTWHGPEAAWVPLLAVIAALSMLVGNLAAIAQSSTRRLLAYSAVGHAGYMLLGILANSELGLRALLYYVITYGLATVGAFGVLAALEKEGMDEIDGLAGLSRRAPWLSFCLLIFLLSLAGIPPLSGFFGKFFVFSSALHAGTGLLWLVALAIAMSAVSLYYYLRVLKQVYVRDPGAGAGAIETSLLMRATVGVVALLVVVLGCYPDLLLNWIDAALRAMPH
ncbi:MAG TPA: NADH-quinone oxidoreductase subunit N [Acidobacteriaceae bacterium]|nr:NADH-quinone oxidoreductase subunit N [Acidobacteriaceae bacterium]